MILSLDIETVPLPKDLRMFTKPTMETVKFGNTKAPEKQKIIFDKAVEIWERGENAALSATTGRIAMIGYKVEDYTPMIAGIPEQEKTILENFWKVWYQYYHESSCTTAGHCVKKFDLPFMVRRSIINGLSVPPVVINELQKYSSELIFDTETYWQFGDRQATIKLDRLCALFDIEVKESPVTGKDFYKWFEKDIPECINYNKQDVEAVYQLCGKFGIV